MTQITIHTSVLYDPKKKAFVKDVSIVADTVSGLVVEVYTRTESLPERVAPPDIDLRGKVVCPGFVDAHTHIFLHAYR